MDYQLNIDSLKIRIYVSDEGKEKLPVYFISNYEDETGKIFDECQKNGLKNYILVGISSLSWNKDMTPYPASRLYKKEEDFPGGADEYLEKLTHRIVPSVLDYIHHTLHLKEEYLGLCGYSLGGLFALYTCYKSDIFTYIGCVSSSFWYPSFSNYVKNNELKLIPEKIYFSLGNKEKESKNRVLASVEENTLIIYEYMKEKGITTVFEMNEGGHFVNAEKRVADAILWLLK